MTREELLDAAQNLTPLLLTCIAAGPRLCFVLEEGVGRGGAPPGWWRVQCMGNSNLTSCGGESLVRATAMDLHRLAELFEAKANGRVDDFGKHTCQYCLGVEPRVGTPGDLCRMCKGSGLVPAELGTPGRPCKFCNDGRTPGPLKGGSDGGA